MKEYLRNEERTGVQEAADFGSSYDVQSDFVMVYGFHNLKERIKKWKKAGYVIHLMTGVAWGDYYDYLYGDWDGTSHEDEGQRYRNGTYMDHHQIRRGDRLLDAPYMCPTVSFSHYLAKNLKYAIDCGVEAIHLEEPEYWAFTGYSEAFKREWLLYYKEPWMDPQSSPDAQYRASKLKQYLYTRALDHLCSELKEYALVKHGRFLRFYVPTHSLISYSQIYMVSPESALIDLPVIDGYIAQIWTGTARVANHYRGICRERTFETAFLEYGIMQELVRGTGRRMWFLADPVEDDASHTWVDYRENYYRTVTASLFHPAVSDYEVSPWPHRVMIGRHALGKEEGSGIIPAEYKTNLLTVMHVLRDMKDQTDVEWIENRGEVGVLLADSAMFQRTAPDGVVTDGLEYPSFYGMALPLLKAGIAARPVQLDNVRRFAGYLDPYHTLVLSYEFMKPSSPDIHQVLAGWVRNGGKLVYIGDGSDDFHGVREWWNTGKNDYANPAEHLFEALGLERHSADGTYPLGDGSVTVLNRHPRDIAQNDALSDTYRDTVFALLGLNAPSSALVLRRGCYTVTAVMDEGGEESHELKGLYVDLYDHRLSVIEDPLLAPGSVGLWYDCAHIDRSESSDILALSGRAEKLQKSQRSLRFTFRGPSEMEAACRIWTKRPPLSITCTHGETVTSLPFEYEPDSETTLFTFPSDGTPVKISVRF